MLPYEQLRLQSRVNAFEAYLITEDSYLLANTYSCNITMFGHSFNLKLTYAYIIVLMHVLVMHNRYDIEHFLWMCKIIFGPYIWTGIVMQN